MCAKTLLTCSRRHGESNPGLPRADSLTGGDTNHYTMTTPSISAKPSCFGELRQAQEHFATGTRTRVSGVRILYPDRLDYSE